LGTIPAITTDAKALVAITVAILMDALFWKESLLMLVYFALDLILDACTTN